MKKRTVFPISLMIRLHWNLVAINGQTCGAVVASFYTDQLKFYNSSLSGTVCESKVFLNPLTTPFLLFFLWHLTHRVQLSAGEKEARKNLLNPPVKEACRNALAHRTRC